MGGCDDWFGLLIVLAVLGIMSIGYMGLKSDKTVKCYYLTSTATDAGVAYKIKGSAPWIADENAFSSHDPDKTMAVFGTLPQCGCEEEAK